MILQNDDYDKVDKLKQTLDDLSIREINKAVPLVEKKSFASGFAIYDHRRDTCFGDVFKRADEAMYENKKMLKSL